MSGLVVSVVTYQLPAAGQSYCEGGSGQTQSLASPHTETTGPMISSQNNNQHAQSLNSLTTVKVSFQSIFKISFLRREERGKHLRVISLDREREGYRKIFIFLVNIISHVLKN